MTSNVVKIAIASALALSFASTGIAMEKQASSITSSTPISQTSFEVDNREKTASICAMDLMPEAQSIFYAVSPKVNPEANLKKLVKKNVRPKVFSGKLSIKSAKANAKAASACLRILKHGHTDTH